MQACYSIQGPEISTGKAESSSRTITDVIKFALEEENIKNKIKEKYMFEFSVVDDHYTVVTLEPRAARSFITPEGAPVFSTGFVGLDCAMTIAYFSSPTKFLRDYILDLHRIITERLSCRYTHVQLFLYLLIVLSEQTAIVRHFGNESTGSMGRMWTMFSDWETTLGKIDYKQAADLGSQIEPWLTSPPIPRSMRFYSLYLQNAIGLANTYFMPRPLRSLPQLTFREFLERPELWGTTGSGYTGLSGHTQNKWQIYGSYSTDELYHSCLSTDIPPLKTIPKPELTKVRAVISSPFQTYALMSYIEYLLSDTIVRSDFTTTLMSDHQRQVFESDFININGNWRTPIDQSHFDYHPDGIQIDIWIMILTSLVRQCVQPHLYNDIERVTRTIRYTCSYPNLKLRLNDSLFTVRHGLASGWKWTALLGALINATQLHTIARISGYSEDIIRFTVQGDDIDLVTASRRGAEAIVETYATERFEVNPKKFWISRERDEFLRRVASKGTSAGYPMRMLIKLLFQLEQPADAQPWVCRWQRLDHIVEATSNLPSYGRNRSIESLSAGEVRNILMHKPARTSELVSQWFQFLGRLQSTGCARGVMSWAARWFKRDVTHATKVSWPILAVLLEQPREFYGYGVSLTGIYKFLHPDGLRDPSSYSIEDVVQAGHGDGQPPVCLAEQLMVYQKVVKMNVIYPVGVRVQSPKEDVQRLKQEIRSSKMSEIYERIFRNYRLTEPTLELWRQRLGDCKSPQRAASLRPGFVPPLTAGLLSVDLESCLAQSHGVGVRCIELMPSTDASAVREIPASYHRIASLYVNESRFTSERDRLARPDDLYLKVQRLSGYSRTFIRKVVHILQKPIVPLLDARFLNSIPNNWELLAQTASLCLLTVPWKRLAIAQTQLAIRTWVRSYITDFHQFLFFGGTAYS